MKLTSAAFADNGTLPTDATCAGSGKSPALSFSDIPVGAKSLALIMHDPDGVHGDFTHWLLWNIPPDVGEVPEGSVPVGAVSGTNDYPNAAYGSACPPAGTGVHRYIFVLYAVDALLTIPPGSKRAELESALQSHILATAQLTGTVAS